MEIDPRPATACKVINREEAARLSERRASNFCDVLIALVERLPFAELSIVALAGLTIGGFTWRLPTVMDLPDRGDGKVPFYVACAFFWSLAAVCLGLLWIRTPLTERQLRGMLRRRGPRVRPPAPGLPTVEEYEQDLRLGTTLMESERGASHD